VPAPVPLALIGRSDSNKGTRKSRRWESKDSENEKDNLVEAFTQHSKRFIVVDGAHSAGRAYAYYGRPLLDVAIEVPQRDVDGPKEAATDSSLRQPGMDRHDVGLVLTK
jgi:hypothetical protein